MKLHSFILIAGALLSAMPLLLSAKTEETIHLSVDVDRAVLPAETTEKAVVKVALDGIKLPQRHLRPPVNLAIVIDRSGSMAGEKIAKAREAALEAVHRLSPDDIVSLVVFDHKVDTLVPARRVGDGRALEEAICSIEVGGNTAIYAGMTRGAAEVRRHSEDRRYVNRVILLSDGLANVGPSSPGELGRLGASLVKEGISVTTVGLGLGFNEDLMTQLAQRSDGNTYFVENSADLPRIFASELGDVLSVVARRLVIEIEFPEGVRPLCFVGRDGTIHGQKAELTLNQLYGGQQKFALIEVEVSPNKSGAEREIAAAHVAYEDALNQRSATITAKRTIQFSTSETAVIASADKKLQADYAANVLALAKDEAVALVDANRRDEAGALLRRRAAEMSKVAEVYQNSAVAAAAAPAAVEADRVAREGLDNVGRKLYRAESSQIRNQQAVTNSSAP